MKKVHRIIFVDDEQNILDAIRRSMSIHLSEWDICYAIGGHEALDFMHEKPADVVITDIAMPMMNGKELIEQLVEKFPEVVIIVLSGHWTQSLAFSELGPRVRFLSKPVSNELLIWTISQATGQAQMPPVVSDKVEAEEFKLRDFIDSECAEAARRSKEKMVGLYVEIDSALPSKLKGNLSLTRECLQKILINAVKFTHKGSIELRVLQFWDRHDDVAIRFEVEDSGVGVPIDKQATLLSEPGMAQFRQAAIRMGGEAGFDSRAGEGSLFWFVAVMGKTC